MDPLIAVRSLKDIAKLWVFSGASTQFNSGEMPPPKALPSQLNSAGREPFASNEGLVISNAAPPDELLDEEDEEDELLDELDELLDEELLEDEELPEELLDDELLEPPQPAIAVVNRATLHAKRVLFMMFSPIGKTSGFTRPVHGNHAAVF